MGLTKPIEQYLFSNLLTKIHVVVYLKDIIRGDTSMKKLENKIMLITYADCMGNNFKDLSKVCLFLNF